jgi:3-dehydroquinate dehydratase-1
MNTSKKTVSIRGKIFGKHPLICTPLVGTDVKEIMREVETIRQKEPDMIEWRADFFKNLGDPSTVVETASKIREAVGQTAILFTIRSEKEGGQAITLTEDEKIQLIVEVCKSQLVDLIDYELMYADMGLSYLRQVSKENGISMIISYHNFHATPGREEIMEKLMKAESLGADIAKVAVMPQTEADVLVLLQATQDAREQLSIPVITMSMGGLGSITRMIGWIFGSTVTFAVGENGSAPGQIPIEDLKNVLRIVQRSVGE